MNPKLVSALIAFLAAYFIQVQGCGSLVMDKSADAFTSGDFTLISACQTVPGRGVDSCQFSEGDDIKSAWRLVIPPPKSAAQVIGETVDVYFKDLHKSYTGNGTWVTEIPWADFLGVSKWSKEENKGIVEALVTMNWVDNQGVNQVTQYRGLAVLFVTAPGYERMPIDSGNAAWGTTCKINLSTAGRSALDCK